MTAVSAIDMALWDLSRRSRSTHRYIICLAEKAGNRILVYAHANGKNLDDTIEKIRTGEGKRISCQSGSNPVSRELIDTYGVSEDNKAIRTCAAGLAPRRLLGNLPNTSALCPGCLLKCRKTFGEEIHLLHDVHHRCTPIEAARLAKELEPSHLFWLEDPVTGELQEGLRLIRQHSVTPIAIGEVFNSIYDYTTLITEQLIDFIRMPLAHGGGITQPFEGVCHGFGLSHPDRLSWSH